MVYKHRRNFLPTFIVNIILWISCVLIVFLLSPSLNFTFYILHYKFVFPVAITLFFLALTPSLTLTLSLLLANSRRGFLLSLFLSITLLFRLLKICHWWNILIVFLLVFFAEYWFWKKSSPKKRKAPLLKF